MVTIKVDVDESILSEAEKALHVIGMDVNIAVNIFLRRVAIEKGFPMSMTAPAPKQREISVTEEKQEPLNEEFVYQPRNNGAITKNMVDEVWRAFIRYTKDLGEINRLSDEVSENSGMNRGSAFIYLNILSKLTKGEPNTRTMKMKDLEYFMEKIKSELGENAFQNAIESLKQSIPYWREKLAGTFADNVEKYIVNIRINIK